MSVKQRRVKGGRFAGDLHGARDALGERALIALEEQLDLLRFTQTSTAAHAYGRFLEAYGYRKTDMGHAIVDARTADDAGVKFRNSLAYAVQVAPTYFVSPNMCQLARHAADDLVAGDEMVDRVLLPDDLPSPAGFVRFAEPLSLVTPSIEDVETPALIYAAAWHTAPVMHGPLGERVEKPGITYFLFSKPGPHFRVAADHPKGLDVPAEYESGEAWVRATQGPLPLWDFSGWVFGHEWTSLPEAADPHEQIPVGFVDPHVGMARAFLLSVWRLMQQEIAVAGGTRLPRGLARRAERAHHVGDVVVVKLRKEYDPFEGLSEGEKLDSSTWWTHRWVVRPHWAWRACGPGKTERRRVYIAPYVKGPEGAPLVVKDHVFSLER